jgi:hypothetical protein
MSTWPHRQGEWWPLAGKCLQTREASSWTYEACLFGSAAQIGGDGVRTRLGSWTGFADGTHKTAVYKNGDPCPGDITRRVACSVVLTLLVLCIVSKRTE